MEGRNWLQAGSNACACGAEGVPQEDQCRSGRSSGCDIRGPEIGTQELSRKGWDQAEKLGQQMPLLATAGGAGGPWDWQWKVRVRESWLSVLGAQVITWVRLGSKWVDELSAGLEGPERLTVSESPDWSLRVQKRPSLSGP